jgi:hypothetical protein
MQEINEKGLYDIYSIWHVPFWQTKAFYITISIIVSSLLLVIIWLFARWYFRKKTVIKQPWEVALEQLHLLQQNSYQSKEEGKQCYFAMTSIIKNYLVIRFAYPLEGKTDDEMICYLANIPNHNALADELKEIIEGCIYIKFANQTAMQETIMKHLEQCTAIVKKTIPAQPSKSAQAQ